MSETARGLQALGVHVVDEVVEENRRLRETIERLQGKVERLRERIRHVPLVWAVPPDPTGEDGDGFEVDSGGMHIYERHSLDLFHNAQFVYTSVDFGGFWSIPFNRFLQSEVRVGDFLSIRGEGIKYWVYAGKIRRNPSSRQPELLVYLDIDFAEPSSSFNEVVSLQKILRVPFTFEQYMDLTGLTGDQIIRKYGTGDNIDDEWEHVENDQPIRVTSDTLQRFWGPDFLLNISRFEVTTLLIRRKAHLIGDD